MNIVVIIPTYNEAENIGRMLDILSKEVFPQIKKNHKMKVLVVDDNSPDGTAKIVKEKMKSSKNIELLLGQKQGLGAAYARGMKYAMEKMSAEAVVEMDADFQHNPKDIIRMVKEFDKGYDYVVGSKYVKGGSIPKQWEPHRKFLSWAGNIFARTFLLIFGVKDVTSGFKLTRVKGFLNKINLNNLLSKSYAYKIHMMYDMVKGKGAKVKEIPIKFHYRERGSSKIEHEDILESLRVVMLLFFRSRFFKFGIVGFTGFMINAFGLEIFSGTRITENLANNFAGWRNQAPPLAIAAQPSAWAAALAAEIAIMSNYTLNNFWTFSKKRIKNPLRFIWKFLHFNLTSFGAVLIQFLVIGFAVLLFGERTLIRQAALVFAVIFFIVPYNYTMYNVFIWKTWKIPGLRWLQNRKGFFT